MVSSFSRSSLMFVVEELASIEGWSQRNYRVRLMDRWCDYEYFQTLHYPCSHVLAMCAYARLDWASYIDDVYRTPTVFNVYRMKFIPIVNEDYWSPYSGPWICPNPELRWATEACLVLMRIWKEMYVVEPRQLKHCGLCKQEGHTKQRCPTVHASSSSWTSEDN